jgi:cytochrome d ubiquinol oxidase subunit II
MAAVACAYLAATYMALESARRQTPALERSFRGRALVAGGMLSLLAGAGLVVARADAPWVFAGLCGRALPLAALSALAGTGSLAALRARRYQGARALAALAIASILGGWMVAQWPYLIVPDLTYVAAAAPPPTLVALLIGAVAGGALLAPALVLLYRLFAAREK